MQETFDINKYADWTIKTAVYPGAGEGGLEELAYLALGLAGEAGEVANKIKKLLRDGGLSERGTILNELGDVAWYWARLCIALDISPAAVLRVNQRKLEARQKAGTIKGSGDSR